MTKDNAHLFLPRIVDLVAALAEGQLQWKNSSGVWEDTANVNFDSDPLRYRRKPKPREFWVRVYHSGEVGAAYTESEHKEAAPITAGTFIRVREVLE